MVTLCSRENEGRGRLAFFDTLSISVSRPFQILSESLIMQRYAKSRLGFDSFIDVLYHRFIIQTEGPVSLFLIITVVRGTPRTSLDDTQCIGYSQYLLVAPL